MNGKRPREAKAITDWLLKEGGRAVFISLLLSSCFLRAGYRHGEVIEFVKRRLERLASLSSPGNYNIHYPVQELAGLPKPWQGKPIIRAEHDPCSGTSPLPLIHDYTALAWLPADCLTRKERGCVARIVA